jgi:hypothetical protein
MIERPGVDVGHAGGGYERVNRDWGAQVGSRGPEIWRAPLTRTGEFHPPQDLPWGHRGWLTSWDAYLGSKRSLQLHGKLKPFKERVAEDIRDEEDVEEDASE